MIKKFFIAPIRAYQYISKMLPANCRYYPTCSEYAKWQFKFNSPHKALLYSSLRIARCNQLFRGGIDYPIVDYKRVNIITLSNLKNIKIRYWLIPNGGNRYFVIKSFA